MLTYVLVVADSHDFAHVQERIAEICGEFLDQVIMVYGEFDFLVKIKTKTPEQVNVLLREIKSTDGVKYLKTYVVSVPTRNWDVVPKDIIQHH